MAFGAADGTREWCGVGASEDGGSNYTAKRLLYTSGCLFQMNPSNGNTVKRASLSSWSSSSFTLNFLSASGLPTKMYYLLIGGDDFSARVDTGTVPTSTGNQDYTGVADGKALITWNGGGITSLNSTLDSFGYGIGFSDNNGNSRSRALFVQDSTNTVAWRQSNSFAIEAGNSAGSTSFGAFFSTHNPSGASTFRLNWSTVAGSTYHFGYIHLGGSGLKAKVGEATATSTASNINLADQSPRAVLFSGRGVSSTGSGGGTGGQALSIGYGNPQVSGNQNTCTGVGFAASAGGCSSFNGIPYAQNSHVLAHDTNGDSSEDNNVLMRAPANNTSFQYQRQFANNTFHYLALGVEPFALIDLSGTGAVDIQGQGQINLDHELTGAAGVEIDATGTIAGGLAALLGGAEVGVQGTGEIRGVSALEGQSQIAVQGAGSIIISDYSFKWSIDFLEARSDHEYPTIYAEVNSSEMPSGAFPEGAFFERRLLEMPRLEEAELGERFGIMGFQRVTLSLDNSDGLISSLDLTDAYVRLFFVSETGDVREWKGRVTEWTLSHRCTVSIEDMDAVALTEELPRRTLNDVVEVEKEADSGFDDVVVANDLGRPVPVIFGRSVKVPLLYIKADEAAREYDYIIGEGEGLGGGNFTDVFTIYREDQALDDIEGDAAPATSTTLTLEAGDRRPDGWYRYWWVEITAGTGAGQIRHVTAYDSANNRVTVNASWSPTPNSGSDYRLREWRFYDGSQASPYEGLAFIRFKKRLGTSGSTDAIYADVNGLTAETNVVRAVESILSNPVWGLGLDIDSGSFDTAAALTDISDMLCEGAITDNTTITDILNGSGESQGLLSFRDMVLSKADAVKITVDGSKPPAHGFGLGDETGWNNILTGSPEITHQHSGERVKNLKVRYRKNNKESDLYLHEIERQSGAGGVDRALTLPFVHDHETADRWLDYRRKRLAAAVRRMAIETGQEGGSVRRGERVTVSVPTLGLEGSAWEVAAVSSTPAGSNSLTLVPYSAAPYTYVPVTDEGGELPSDESFDIAPDYTQTMPDPVTGVAVTMSMGIVGFTAHPFALITWTPPEDNYSGAVVSVKLHSDGVAAYRSAGTFPTSARIEGLVPGQVYDFLIESLNATGELKGLGVVADNSGSGYVAGGDSTAPAAPAGLSGDSKFGRLIWTWNGNTETDVSHYEVEIYTSSSGGSPVIKDVVTHLNDSSFTPRYEIEINTGSLTSTVTRWLRVRAKDHSGNPVSSSSGWTSRVSAGTGDILQNDIENDEITNKVEAVVSSIALSPSGTTIISTSITKRSGTRIRVEFSMSIETGTGFSSWSHQLRRGVSTIQNPFAASSFPSNGTGGASGVYVDNISSSGTFTYSVVLNFGASGNTGRNLNLRLLELRR
ncbi:MAG TPA: fibronectin type III domain-containing protein [Thermodesulfobacteriota bacterium]|nr:fibronectin type III domain-containing protein [Thermodesulfobacteriota bacterium]